MAPVAYSGDLLFLKDLSVATLRGLSPGYATAVAIAAFGVTEKSGVGQFTGGPQSGTSRLQPSSVEPA